MDINPNALYLALSSDLASHFARQSLRRCDASKETIAACFNLQNSLVAKLGSSKGSETADAAAYTKWQAANDKCAAWSLSFGDDGIDELLWGELRKAVYDFFWVTGDKSLIGSLEDVAVRGSHGPGASNGICGTSMYEKSFVGGMTGTSELLYIAYRRAHSKFPDYLKADDFGTRVGGGLVELKESQCFFVPKNADISRLAATEPSLNMFFQKGVSKLLERRLVEVFNIDLASQPDRNRALAKVGSINGSFATIDLSSASDSISQKLVKSILPRGVYDVLDRCRTPAMKVGDELVTLNMFSTMGNGFTFSLESVIFSCIVQACYRVAGIPLKKGWSWFGPKSPKDWTDDSHGNFAVFGDDIIVRSEAVPLVKRLLSLCGFSINRKKTFVQGPFRESCGGDYYNGRNVRGVFIKLLETREHVFHAVNSLVNWSAEHGVGLYTTVKLLMSLVPKKDHLFVPPLEQTDAGFHVPLEYFEIHGGASPGRKSDDLGCRFVYKASVPKVKRVNLLLMDILPGLTLIRLNAVKGRGNLVYNETGWFQCILSGHVANGGWAARQQTPTFRTIRKVTPNWHIRPGSSESWMAQWATTALHHL